MNISMLVLFFILIFIFRTSVFGGLSQSTNFLFRPILSIGSNISENFARMRYFFLSKKSLLEENGALKKKVSEIEAHTANHDSLIEENLKLKEILNRKDTGTEFVLATILSKPNTSLYDTLLIDVGGARGLVVGDAVFAFGNIPIGRVSEVFETSAKVVLFSTSGEKTEGIVQGKDVFLQLIGRGGGNFESIIPRDFTLEKGTEVVMPGIKPYLVATVEGILSDPRDSYKKAIFRSPVNIQELKFVQVRK